MSMETAEPFNIDAVDIVLLGKPTGINVFELESESSVTHLT